MKNTFLILLVIMLASCRSNSLYRQLKNNQDLTVINRAGLKGIASAVSDSLGGSPEILLLYQSYYSGLDHKVKMLSTVYDYKTKRYLFLEGDSHDSPQVRLVLHPDDGFNDLKFAAKYYLENRIDILKLSENPGISEGGLSNTFIFDINVKKKMAKVSKFESMLFNRWGVPITLESIMRGSAD